MMAAPTGEPYESGALIGDPRESEAPRVGFDGDPYASWDPKTDLSGDP
jgi:hypothetical protein